MFIRSLFFEPFIQLALDFITHFLCTGSIHFIHHGLNIFFRFHRTGKQSFGIFDFDLVKFRNLIEYRRKIQTESKRFGNRGFVAYSRPS